MVLLEEIKDLYNAFESSKLDCLKYKIIREIKEAASIGEKEVFYNFRPIKNISLSEIREIVLFFSMENFIVEYNYSDEILIIKGWTDGI